MKYYLLYEYNPKDEENPYKPYSNIINPITNIFAPDDLKLGGLNEIIKFLRIMSRICESTSSYGNPGQENYGRSPVAFLRQLEGLIMNYPEAGLKIFDTMGGFEAMEKIREFYPLQALTNVQQKGLIIYRNRLLDLINTIAEMDAIINDPTKTEQEKQKAQIKLEQQKAILEDLKTRYPEAWAFYEISPRSNWIPTSINGYIFILSIIGAERVGGQVVIPMKWHDSDNSFAFSINGKIEKDEEVAKFTIGECKETLDKIGFPMKILLDKNGKPVQTNDGRYKLEYFLDAANEKKAFNQLNAEERGQVVAINLKYRKTATEQGNVDPYLIKKVFGEKNIDKW